MDGGQGEAKSDGEEMALRRRVESVEGTWGETWSLGCGLCPATFARLGESKSSDACCLGVFEDVAF
jgi:hypothetical protein